MKRPLVVLGLLTALLGAVGLYARLDAGIPWLLLLVGFSAMLAAGTVTAEPRFGAPAAMGLGVATVTLAFAGVARQVPSWMDWSVFWMGAAYVLLAVAGSRLWRRQHAWVMSEGSPRRPFYKDEA